MSIKIPKISIIVIAYRMSKQLKNTLLSLAAEYQSNVSSQDYEVVVVENKSEENLDASFIDTLADNFRYFLREDSSISPVAAINFGFQQCRAPYVGLMIDGARMLSPGVLQYTLMATMIDKNATVAVPGYHIGDKEQHLQEESYSAEQEQSMLSSLNWQEDGYQLFDVSTFSNGNRRGFMQPMHECNCLFGSMENFKRIGYANPRFSLAGGGSLNLHIYRSLGLCQDSPLFVLAGEGSFHQFHGGVTTSNHATLKHSLQEYKDQLNELWPDGGFQALRREPILLGKISPQCTTHLQTSCDWAVKRSNRLRTLQQDLWPDDILL
jgi:glycosyltransferase involved in cell wall biosynthesis